MSLYVLDTDILSLAQHAHATVCQRIRSHPAQDVTITVISLQEQIEGWQGMLGRARTRQQIASAYERLGSFCLPSWARFRILSFTEPAILRFEQLLTLRLNVGRMDLRIAAIALENAAVVVTRNQRDFGRVPGLTLEDWSV
jgi:tRNA(fMet)-specific endonuclease VapC